MREGDRNKFGANLCYIASTRPAKLYIVTLSNTTGGGRRERTIIIIVVVVVNIRKLLVKELEKRPKELKVFAAPIGGTTI